VKKAPAITAADCASALKAAFPLDQYAFFEQVADGVGWSTRRRADAVVMGLWPSRGLWIQGFEIKVTRQDWKRELKNAAKAEDIQLFCDFWWIVAPQGMLPPEELPGTWGLYEVSEQRKLRVRVKAPKLEPKELSREFVAAIFRLHSDATEKMVARERASARREALETEHGPVSGKLEQLAQTLNQMDRPSGRARRQKRAPQNAGDVARVGAQDPERRPRRP
jgi:hypothetical protein